MVPKLIEDDGVIVLFDYVDRFRHTKDFLEAFEAYIDYFGYGQEYTGYNDKIRRALKDAEESYSREYELYKEIENEG